MPAIGLPRQVVASRPQAEVDWLTTLDVGARRKGPVALRSRGCLGVVMTVRSAHFLIVRRTAICLRERLLVATTRQHLGEVSPTDTPIAIRFRAGQRPGYAPSRQHCHN